MNTRFLLLLLSLMGSNAIAQSSIQVAGALREIMQGGDLAPKISVNTISLSTHTYGLGVASGLKGEIVIVEGKCLRSYIENEKVITRQESDTKAAMLVTSDVKSFVRSESIELVSSIRDLEQKIKQVGEKLYKGMPFAFLIRAKVDTVDYHIIDWRDGTAHTPSNHKQFAKQGSFLNEEVVIVGFYSENHQGVFTPHSTKVHMHVYSPLKNVAGHVDGLMSTKPITILLQ